MDALEAASESTAAEICLCEVCWLLEPLSLLGVSREKLSLMAMLPK